MKDQLQVETLAQWILAHSIILYGFIGLAVVALLLMYHSTRGVRAAARIIRTQFNRLSQDELEELEAYASQRNQLQLVRSSLRAIREQHGHDGVRVGHVMLLMQAMHGDYVVPAQWPSFRPPAGTPDPTVVSM